MISGKEILNCMKNGNIIIEPFDISKLNPNSYNVTLAPKLKVYKKDIVLDPKKDNEYEEFEIPEEGFILQPGELYIASTNEYTETYGFVPCISGRSSMGRLGISVHVTAGFGDNGFMGKWTLEITVVRPVIIYPNMQIAQLYYEPIDGQTADLYHGRYLGQKDAETSRYFKG